MRNRMWYLVYALLTSAFALFFLLRFISDEYTSSWFGNLIGVCLFMCLSVVFWWGASYLWNAQLPTEYMLEISKMQYCSKCGKPLLVKIKSYNTEVQPLPVDITYLCPSILSDGHIRDFHVNLNEELIRKSNSQSLT